MSFNIVVKLLGDGKGFESMLVQAKGHAARFGSSIKGQLAGAFSVAAVTVMVKKNLEYADSLDDMSKKLGVTTTQLQEWDYAARLNGASIADFTSGIKGLSDARAEAMKNPSGDKMSMFKLLGIDPAALNSSTIGELFNKVAAAFKSKNFGAGEANMVSRLLGRGGMTLLPLMKDGLAGLSDEAHRLGLVLSEDVVKKLAEMADSFTRIGLQFTRAFAEPVTKVAKAIEEIMSSIDNSPDLAGLRGWQKNKDEGWEAAFGGFERGKLEQEDKNAFRKKIAAEEAMLWKTSVKNPASPNYIPPVIEAVENIDIPTVIKAKAAKVKRIAPLPDVSTDALARIGGFTGSGVSPQQRQLRLAEETNNLLKSMERDQGDLLSEVQKINQAIDEE